MTVRIAQIWRHPIKSHGTEALERIDVKAGQTLPWDRTWAVRHEASKTDGTAWAHCANFSRGSKAPGLLAIASSLDETTTTITLRHPNLTPLTFRPDVASDLDAFLGWTAPLIPKDRAASVDIIRVNGRGMTDTDFPSISLANLATLKALSEKLEQPLDPRRFRANFWIEGLAAWQEFDWVGQDIIIGDVTFHAQERTGRCLATTSNPHTGTRDADTLGALKSGWGHTDFGIYLTAKSDGPVAVGQTVSP